MKTSVIKNHLKKSLNWNYSYFNVVDEDGRIIEQFDFLIDAQLYISKHKRYFIQKCHNVSYIL